MNALCLPVGGHPRIATRTVTKTLVGFTCTPFSLLLHVSIFILYQQSREHCHDSFNASWIYQFALL